jgi:hypothetical protein
MTTDHLALEAGTREPHVSGPGRSFQAVEEDRT